MHEVSVDVSTDPSFLTLDENAPFCKKVRERIRSNSCQGVRARWYKVDLDMEQGSGTVRFEQERYFDMNDFRNIFVEIVNQKLSAKVAAPNF